MKTWLAHSYESELSRLLVIELQWNLRIKNMLGQGVLSLWRGFLIWRFKCTGIIGIGTSRFVFYIFIRRLKCTGIIGIGMSRFREVFFIWSVLYRRFHCIPCTQSVVGRTTTLCIHRLMLTTSSSALWEEPLSTVVRSARPHPECMSLRACGLRCVWT